ncbi:hypothetical protein GCM10027430_36080 [Lysobacter tyrosinilyticus]
MRALLLFAVLIALCPAADAASLLGKLGLKSGMTYSTAKARMARLGWAIDTSEPVNWVAYPKTPEVLCGRGWDAVCSVRFTRNGEAVMLTLKPLVDHLKVIDAESD